MPLYARPIPRNDPSSRGLWHAVRPLLARTVCCRIVSEQWESARYFWKTPQEALRQTGSTVCGVCTRAYGQSDPIQAVEERMPEREIVVKRTVTVEYATSLESYYDSVEKHQMTEQEVIDYERNLSVGEAIEVIIMQLEEADTADLHVTVSARDKELYPDETTEEES